MKLGVAGVLAFLSLGGGATAWARPSRARASSTPSTGTSTGDAEPTGVGSLRLMLGLGGGGGAVAGRVGGLIDVWLSESFGVGVVGAATGLIQTDFEEARSYVLLAPTLSVRGKPDDGYLYGSGRRPVNGLSTWGKQQRRDGRQERALPAARRPLTC